MADMSGWTVTQIDAALRMTPRTVDLEFVKTGNVQTKTFASRRFHGLIFRTDDTYRYTVEGGYVLDNVPGSVLYLPQGRPYFVQGPVDTRGDCYCVNFHIAEETDAAPFVIMVRRRDRWLELYSRMVRLWTYPQPGSRARLRSMLYEMLALLEEDRRAHYLPEQYASVIRSRMGRLEEEQVSMPLPVGQLAEECGMSETYFRRLFHEMYGMSPKQYLLEAQFRRARTLLTETDASVSTVAEMAGFQDLYRFSRAFRAHEGVSPSGYRQNYGGKSEEND